MRVFILVCGGKRHFSQPYVSAKDLSLFFPQDILSAVLGDFLTHAIIHTLPNTRRGTSAYFQGSFSSLVLGLRNSSHIEPAKLSSPSLQLPDFTQVCPPRTSIRLSVCVLPKFICLSINPSVNFVWR